MARGMDAPSSRFTRRSAHLAMAGTFLAPFPIERAAALGFQKELKPRRTSIPRDAYVNVRDTSGLLAAEVRAGDPNRTAALGDRVAVHYDVKWKNLTIGSSRVGAGVTGGTPYGFDVGRFGGCALHATDASEANDDDEGGGRMEGTRRLTRTPRGGPAAHAHTSSTAMPWLGMAWVGHRPGGPFIRALDEGVVGMGVGGQRRLIVPPKYGYGNKQVQEIPPGSTLVVDLELLSIKTNPLQRKTSER